MSVIGDGFHLRTVSQGFLELFERALEARVITVESFEKGDGEVDALMGRDDELNTLGHDSPFSFANQQVAGQR
jgi:hypothetical protein